jgi:ABC-type multidrug transport system fused ATPase/permease subunit
MRGPFPFAALLRKLMMNVERRYEWKKSTAKRTVVRPGVVWTPADLAGALRVEERTAQQWTSRTKPREPGKGYMLGLERLLPGPNSSHEDRQEFRDAWELQRELRKRREACEEWDVKKHRSPYRGIAEPLTEQHAAIFFGRRNQLAGLTKKVSRNAWVFVIGPSGAGKSSLVRAGLIPNLIARNAISGSHAWRWEWLTPGVPGGADARARGRAGAGG